jgi:RNA 2',3'-cyclic 3'-phosphodiesterase
MRLFVAVWPPPEVVATLAALPRPEVDGVRWTTADQWHVTLRFLGTVDDAAAVEGALTSVRAPATRAVMGPAVIRLSRHVLCVPVAGLEQVAAGVTSATTHLGHPPEDRPFKGHLTLARGRPGAHARPPAGAALAAEWNVGEVCLVESRLHPHGARYQVRARFSLE